MRKIFIKLKNTKNILLNYFIFFYFILSSLFERMFYDNQMKYTRFHSSDLAMIFSTITNSSNILILTHKNPDGDSIGSTSAFYSFCKRIMKNENTQIENIIYGGMDDIPKIFKNFIPYTSKYEVITDIPDSFLDDENSLIICLDTSNIERCIPNYLQIKDKLENITLINIDHHHLNNTMFANFNYVFEASSCSELIAELIMQISKSKKYSTFLKENEALALYTGIKTDTGNFTYNYVDVKTLQRAADIAEFLPKEAMATIDGNLMKSKPEGFLKAVSKVLNNVIYVNNSEVAILPCRKEIFQITETNSDDLKELVNFPFKVIPVKMIIFITESTTNTDEYLISVRSRSPYSARSFAMEFGGGGHELASGAVAHYNNYNDLISSIISKVENIKLDCK